MNQTERRSRLKRPTLRKVISNAWETCLDVDYPERVINGERALQACFYHRLVLALENLGKYPKRTIFVEPQLGFDNVTFPSGREVVAKTPQRRKIYFPDLVVCDSTKVIAVIELKFLPKIILFHSNPQELNKGVKKDIRTFSEIAHNLMTESHQQTMVGMNVLNERYLGVRAKEKTYQISPDCLMIWAGVHKKPADTQLSTQPLIFQSSAVFEKMNWLEIHSLTADGEHPKTCQLTV